jgi:hypothetical protein
LDREAILIIPYADPQGKKTITFCAKKKGKGWNICTSAVRPRLRPQGKMLYLRQHTGEIFRWHDRSLFDAGKPRITQLRHGLRISGGRQ